MIPKSANERIPAAFCVSLTWGGGIPVDQVEGAREALAELFGYCPEFEAVSPVLGLWAVELPAEFAEMLMAFGFVRIKSRVFILTARFTKEK